MEKQTRKSTGSKRKMVDTEVCHRGCEKVAVMENMDNDQSNDELVPTNEQNNDEISANAENDEQRRKSQPSRLESFIAIMKSIIIRALIIYLITNFFRIPVNNSKSPNTVSDTHLRAVNIFPNGTLLDLYVYLSESENFKGFNDPQSLIWIEKGLVYGDWYSGPNQDGSKVLEYSFVPSEKLKKNGSIYLHTYITKSGKSPNPKAAKDVYAGDYMSYTKQMLNKFKKIKYEKRHNLLSGESAASKEEIEKTALMGQKYMSYWHPNLTINLVVDQTIWTYGQVPSPLDEYMYFVPNKNTYKPIIFINDFWNMQRDYQLLNNTTEQLKLRLTYQPISMLKWQIYAAQSVKNKWTGSFLGEVSAEHYEQDALKEALLETSPYLLGLTVIVSILHSIFEFLAFKNDIQFWNNRKSLEGLSVRSVFFNVFQFLIIFLYVMDNETSTVVRFSCAIGLCIEIWKINKVVDINVNREVKVLGIFPKISFQDKGSYVESSTKEYDRLAFKYLSWALYPLLGGYAIYSLIYLEHKGWYSWVLNMLYGFLLTFGFIMMTPQLFINYKLKSVAHLPWRMMSYKFFNTFVDDVFAFVIKMPILYRIGCIRDDIVFFIFLYQRWIYKTDHTRVNEYGFSGEMEAQLEAKNKEQQVVVKDCLEKKNE